MQPPPLQLPPIPQATPAGGTPSLPERFGAGEGSQSHALHPQPLDGTSPNLQHIGLGSGWPFLGSQGEHGPVKSISPGTPMSGSACDPALPGFMQQLRGEWQHAAPRLGSPKSWQSLCHSKGWCS